jgi:hypothetical protein
MTLIILFPTLFTSACAAPCPAPSVLLASPSPEYFVPMAKPLPPRSGERELHRYILELSDSWDVLYGDRMKAREEIRSLGAE